MLSTAEDPASRLVVFAGDIHGAWRRLATNLQRLQRRVGKIDAVFSVGDAQPVRSESELRQVRLAPHHLELGDFPDVVAGKIQIPAPVYFIGGNHEPWESLDDAGPGEWASNVVFLGRAGTTDVAGLRVTFLSGIYSPTVSESTDKRTSLKERTYWLREELAELERQEPGVDVLLTHDWPDGIKSPIPGRPIRFGPGNVAVRELADRLQPKVHACGHHHRSVREMMGPTQLVCLADSSAGMTGLAAFRVNASGRLTEIDMGLSLV